MKFHEAIPGVPVYLERFDHPAPELWVPTVDAWVPLYLHGYGSACMVYQTNGQQFYTYMSPRRILKEIASYYLISREDARERYMNHVNMSQSAPLPILIRRLVYFSVKARDPHEKYDGATGYIANTRVATVARTGSRTCTAHLASGHAIDLLMSANNFRQQQMRAEHLLYRSLEDHAPEPLR